MWLDNNEKLQLFIDYFNKNKKLQKYLDIEKCIEFILDIWKFTNKNLFVEWQEVYSNKFYGTYLKELNRIWSLNKVVLLDVDVFGGINIKNKFEKNCLSIFIMPPSKHELLNRLKKRDSESQSQLLEREQKMDLELNQSSKFDCIIKNIILEEACLEAEKIIRNFLK